MSIVMHIGLTFSAARCPVPGRVPKNVLGTIQSLYNVIGASGKRVAYFKDIEIDDNLLSLSLKSLSGKRWASRYDAIDEQMESVIKVLIFL